jgi:predicted amidohydrolase YtcJ
MSRSLFLGATIWGGAACAPARGWLLVEGDRIAGVGAEGEPAPPADRVLQLPGCHVLPGFVDVHLHLSQAAWFGRGGDGSRWRTVGEALDAVALAAAASPQAPWLLFWNVARWTWPQGRLPTASELEAAAPGRAVLISTSDMHRGAISAVGLEAAGLAGSVAQATFGDDLSRDRRGRPTGELWESAFGIAVQRALADCAAHAEQAGPHAVLAAEALRYLAHGITHAHDPYVAPDLHEQMAALEPATPLRLSWATGSNAGMHSRPPGPAGAPGGPYGQSGREVKVFADGGDRCAIALPSRAVAALLSGAIRESWRLKGAGPLREALRRKTSLGPHQLRTPYLRYTDDELTGLVTSYAAAGIRLRIHALGNRAGDQAARILRQAGVPQGAATIDHLMLLDPATADAVAASGSTVSYQPGFLPRYGQMLTGSRADRYCTVFGGRLLLDAGCPLSISSDHPSGPLDPLGNLGAAVDRDIGDGQALQPDQALTELEAVRAATVTAAASLGLPAGGLAAGQPADLAVCTGHPFAPGTHIAQTWIAGQQAWPLQAGEHTP